MPAENSSADTSCVLPQPPWPTTATLRMLAASYTFIGGKPPRTIQTSVIGEIICQYGRVRRARQMRPRGLFVSQRFDRIHTGRTPGRQHPEEDAHRGREPEPERERPPRQRDRETRQYIDQQADRAAEQDS